MRYTIKEASEKTQLSAYVLRYYEKEGILSSVHRSKGGIRYYTDEDMETLGLICCLKKTGMQLNEIKAFVQLSSQGKETLRERCLILSQQKEKVKRQIEELQHSYEKVSHKLDHFTKLLREYEGTADISLKQQ